MMYLKMNHDRSSSSSLWEIPIDHFVQNRHYSWRKLIYWTVWPNDLLYFIHFQRLFIKFDACYCNFFSKKQKSHNFQSQQRIFYCKNATNVNAWFGRLNFDDWMKLYSWIFFHFRIFKLVFVVIFIARTHRPKQIETILVQHTTKHKHRPWSWSLEIKKIDVLLYWSLCELWKGSTVQITWAKVCAHSHQTRFVFSSFFFLVLSMIYEANFHVHFHTFVLAASSLSLCAKCKTPGTACQHDKQQHVTHITIAAEIYLLLCRSQ